MTDLDRVSERILELADIYGLQIDPDAYIWQLSVGEQQRVEILKVLYRGANILIMDEPTAVLAPQEIDDLINTMRSMVAQGKSIIFISHKLHEVTAVADRVTVLRKGVVTAEGQSMAGVTKDDLARLMVGRDVVFAVSKKPREAGPVVLEVKDVRAENDKGVPALRGVSLEIRGGEILGIAGVAGNGQRELVETLVGLRLDAMQASIARGMLAAYPPDLLIEIPINTCGAHEFYRANEVIAAGELWAERALERYANPA